MKNQKVEVGLFLVSAFILILLFFGAVKQAYPQHVFKNIQTVETYTIVGDGVTDDTDALCAWGEGKRVIYQGRVLNNVLRDGRFSVNWQVVFKKRGLYVYHNTFIWHYTGYDRPDWIVYWKGVNYSRNTIIDKGMDTSQVFLDTSRYALSW